ncbi:hypothetical protein PR048_016232 [Dryococelus australis]|uniref:DUF5641 domain-containing protein n=1 Tax=Dryococelus australis TaxID=614101 RepID=A0ABQ9HJB5_9NEOP|nr:hypothetical protein PR048_016232 [Dryococelus australis]
MPASPPVHWLHFRVIQNDIAPLTRGLFLIGDAFTTAVEPHLQEVPINILSRWQHTQQLEHLSLFQNRAKWTTEICNLDVGKLLIITDGHLPPLKLIMGHVLDLRTRENGRVRVALVKITSYNQYSNHQTLSPAIQ